MDEVTRDRFLGLWKKYFSGAELPIVFYYTNDPLACEWVHPEKGRSCLVCQLVKVRRGHSLAYSADGVVCGGAKRYMGFTDKMRPDFEYFLSCGLPGKVEGERYKKSPDMVQEIVKKMSQMVPAGKFLVFKRWDKLEERDRPDVVIFFAGADVLSGLFTLANFDETEPNAVIAPFGSGCGSIIHYPYLERTSPRPRAVLGMFDPSARPCVEAGQLTLAMPMAKLLSMVENMGDSFLITPSWDRIRKRIGSS